MTDLRSTGDGDDTEEERAAHATKRRKISERGRRTPVVLAAGGIADGHCLASCLALGCDGAVVGTRFWASEEALGYRAIKAALVGGTGSGSRGTSCDDVVRTTVFDALQNSYRFASVHPVHRLPPHATALPVEPGPGVIPDVWYR